MNSTLTEAHGVDLEAGSTSPGANSRTSSGAASANDPDSPIRMRKSGGRVFPAAYRTGYSSAGPACASAHCRGALVKIGIISRDIARRR
jgi:hypothetical protein